MTAPKRRWPQFSLRTMFVVVTVLAVPLGWIGYSLNWIRQRHEFHKLHETRISSLQNEIGHFEFISAYRIVETVSDKPKNISTMHARAVLRLFGEEAFPGLGLVYVSSEPNVAASRTSDIQRAKDLFPEAIIRTYTHFKREPTISTGFDGFRM